MKKEPYYFEVDFGEDVEADRICIKSVKENPSVEEVSMFCRIDEERFGHEVTSIHPIGREEAEGLYDLSREDEWPVLGE